MPKNLRKNFLRFLIIVLIAGCSKNQVANNQLSIEQTFTPVESTIFPAISTWTLTPALSITPNPPILTLTKTIEPTIYLLPSATNTTTPTLLPVITRNSKSATAIEVVVFTWDWPSTVPAIHVWKDGYSVWVYFNSDNKSRKVYETFLSDSEILKVQQIINGSNLWNYDEPGMPVPDYSWLHIWVNQAGREKTVLVRNGKFETTVSSLYEILNKSSRKTEFIPKQGYLFTWQAKDLYPSDFPWPDKEISFDFNKAKDGIVIDGIFLSTIWNSLQEGYYALASQNKAFDYQVYIPGISFLDKFNETTHLHEFKIFTPGDNPNTFRK